MSSPVRLDEEGWGKGIKVKLASWILFGLLFGAALGHAEKESHMQYYPNIPLEIVFENDLVLVQKAVLQPGEWEGVHSHSGKQLGVNLSDGEVTVRHAGDETIYRGQAGSVVWQPAVDLSANHESGNTGDKPYEFLWLNFKQSAPPTSQTRREYAQRYPNIRGKTIFENDRVLVQRFLLPPGEWEGVHGHSGNQLYVMLTDGHAGARLGDQETSGFYPAGIVLWQPPVPLSERHESGNVGDEPMEFLCFNFKHE